MYLGGGNGLACTAANGGKFEVRGLQDGGWYWITDAMNSAVASLVAKDALGNTAVMPTDPGSSDITLTKMEGGSSTLVKQASTGRIGILHHVLPEPVMEVEEMPHCMPMKSGTKWVSKETGCLLGDGKTKIAMTATVASGAHAGAVYTLGGDTVERPSTGSMTVGMGLWGNGTGRISTSTTEADIQKGWENLPGVTTRMPLDADFMVRVAEVAGEKSTAALADVGVTLKTKDAGTRTVMGAVPGTKPDTGETSVISKNEGDGISNAYGYTVDKMHPGFKSGMTNAEALSYSAKTTGKITYCKQRVTLYDGAKAGTGSGYGLRIGSARSQRQLYADQDTLLNFVAMAPDKVITVNSKLGGDKNQQSFTGDSATADLGASANWSELAMWVAKWNVAFPEYAVMTRVAMDTGTDKKAGTADDVPYVLPVVVCDTQSTTETVKLTQSMTIGLSASHCGESTNKSVKLEIYAPLADTRSNNMHVRPVIAANGKAGSPSVNVAASKMLTITCPATSANRGQELLPDNSWSPFRR